MGREKLSTEASERTMSKDKGKTAPQDRVAWKRQLSDQDVMGRLGQRIRDRRERLGMSLANASELSGIPAATLSRIETNKMSPTFPVLLKLMTGLRLPWADLLGNDQSSLIDEFSIAMPDAGESTLVPGYSYLAPHVTNPLSQHIQPLIFDVLAKDLEGAGGLRGHKGYEFCYVLSGAIIFHVEGREPCELPSGASVLFRCDVPHAYVSQGTEPARVLNLTFVDPVMLEDPRPFGARYPDAAREKEE